MNYDFIIKIRGIDSLVIRQKGEANLKTGVSRKRNRSNFPKNEHPLIRNVRFSENLTCFLFFLETPV